MNIFGDVLQSKSYNALPCILKKPKGTRILSLSFSFFSKIDGGCIYENVSPFCKKMRKTGDMMKNLKNMEIPMPNANAERLKILQATGLVGPRWVWLSQKSPYQVGLNVSPLPVLRLN